ncbi:GTP-binding protein [Entomomonas asaccharolytica]|uniref:ATP/GTP-binding protein n=1 Tax=Entomomonas asaccharolytica TaxID=2785331 RepID=A0A974RW71_9GAMM|nr:ATP/GTP-binding protein [Entomomonas asaccharolytica]QQP84875.1 ATP/GTP-binding protein [Entomomonas asaccharolytica]
MIEYKFIVTGTVGAGKTTLISAISEIPTISTDVKNNDSTVGKESTTVAFDYGQITISENERLRLYGTPGQERFSFMWKVLGQGAMGVIILVDHTRPDPIADLKIYLDNFAELIDKTGSVVCICKFDENKAPSLDDFDDVIAEYKIICPIIAADVRQKEEVLKILDILLTQLENRE